MKIREYNYKEGERGMCEKVYTHNLNNLHFIAIQYEGDRYDNIVRVLNILKNKGLIRSFVARRLSDVSGLHIDTFGNVCPHAYGVGVVYMTNNSRIKCMVEVLFASSIVEEGRVLKKKYCSIFKTYDVLNKCNHHLLVKVMKEFIEKNSMDGSGN